MPRHPLLPALAALVLTAGCGSAKPVAPPPTTTSGPKTTTAVACDATSTTGAVSGPEVNPPGDIPDNQAFITYHAPGGSYTVEVPEGWARTDKPRNVMFSDKFNSIQIELVDAPSAPTAASVKAEVPALAAAARCFRAGPVTVVSRKAGPAVFLKYTDEGPADVVTGKRAIRDVERYAFWHNGVAAVITLAGATGSDNVDPWRRVTGSFAWR